MKCRTSQFFGMVLLGSALALHAVEGDYQVSQVTTPPVIDGDLAEWGKCIDVAMSKANTSDLKVESASMTWDSTNLYLAVKVMDSAIINTNAIARLHDADNVDLRLVTTEGGSSNVWRLVVAPASAEGKPALRLEKRVDVTGTNILLDATTQTPTPSGLHWAVGKWAKGWTVEASIPFSTLGVQGERGRQFPFLLVVWDRDRIDVDDWKEWKRRSENFSQKQPPSRWPSATLVDHVEKWVAPPAATKGKSKKPAELSVGIERHKPCNLFEPTEAVRFAFSLKNFPQGKGEAKAVVVDVHGREVTNTTMAVSTDAVPLVLDLGKMSRGYYELTLSAKIMTAEGQMAQATEKATLGVADFIKRSAAEVREKDYRFGLKWWGGVSDKAETLDMMTKLGLQWTRIIITEGEPYGAVGMLTEFPMNAVIKVERFPKELFDTERYGTLEEWEKKWGRAWSLKTLPRKEPYQQWLTEKLALIDKNQKVFEIWNEPWDKMSAEDCATICSWIVEVILKNRPDAIIGPNLRGSTSDYDYDAKLIKAGGMKGMKMVCLHPYATSEDRAWLRKYRAWISERCGRPIDIYITEYGSHSTPAGPAKRSEVEQARRVVRQSLALYAEDAKALVPHWVGQSERDPTYLEDWFGFIRKNQQVKPVLLAHATSARLIDGSHYLGDVWFGPGVGAMLFDKQGEIVLALWTLGETVELDIPVGAPQVRQIDMYGKDATRSATNGTLHVKVGEDVVYLAGIQGDLVKQASPELRADRWPQPAKPVRQTRTIHKFKTPPVIDGSLDDWKGATEIALLNPKVAGDDASGSGHFAWDGKFFYVAVNMRDNEMLNTQPRPKLYLHDSIELFFSAEPRDDNPGYGPNDHQYFMTPTSRDGTPVLGEVTERAAGVITDIPDSKIAVKKTGVGWTVEAAIPWVAVKGLKPAVGTKAAMEIRVNDADTFHERFKIDPLDIVINTENPTVWSFLDLAE